jgi:putative hydrolase of the HAD superfamily
MIKLIIFDLGNVIVEYKDYWFFDYLAKRFNLDRDEVERAFSGLSEKTELGEMSAAEMEKTVKRRLNIHGFFHWSEFHKRHARLNGRVFNLAKRLKKQYRLAILTNVSRRSYVAKKRDFIRELGVRTFTSFRLHMMKPNPRIYKYVLKECGAKPSEALFIDDTPINVAGAERIGIRGIVFKNYEDLVKELKRFKVL